jgi:VWFA-related protein
MKRGAGWHPARGWQPRCPVIMQRIYRYCKNALACVCLIHTTALAQQTPAFQSETRMVLVDVVVTGRNGEYIPDMSARDFRIWQDNKEQMVRSFSLETDSSATEPRRLVLFFDNTGMSATEQAAARQAAARFADAYAGPNRLMAVVSFDGNFHVLQSFTGNAEALTRAISGEKLFTASSSGSVIADAPEAASEARGLIRSVGLLAGNLNAVPGRKIVVLLTGQQSIASAQQADVESLVQIGNRSNVAVYPVVQREIVQNSPETPAAVDIPRRNSAPRNRVVDTQQQDDSLAFTIARGTGGFVASRSNDILTELQKIGAEQNQYYVLGYTPPDSKDGVCHALRVKVDRSGTALRVRSSYCTAKPQDLLAKSKVEQDLEKRAAAPTSTRVSIQTPFFYASPGMARVHVVMEIPADDLKFENQKGKLHAEINVLGIASAADGDVAARFSDIVKRDFDNKSDLHYEKEFKIVPGQYNLTVVFSSGGANFGKVETPLAIGAWDRDTFAISGLALGRVVRPASDLGLEASLIDEGTPLIAGGMQVIPTGSKTFTRSEQAFCYFEIYSADPVTMTLRIVEAGSGALKWDGGTANPDPPAHGKSTIPVGLNVPIASLSPGSYQFEVTARDKRNKAVIRTVDFEIK